MAFDAALALHDAYHVIQLYLLVILGVFFLTNDGVVTRWVKSWHPMIKGLVLGSFGILMIGAVAEGFGVR